MKKKGKIDLCCKEERTKISFCCKLIKPRRSKKNNKNGVLKILFKSIGNIGDNYVCVTN